MRDDVGSQGHRVTVTSTWLSVSREEAKPALRQGIGEPPVSGR